MYILTFVRGFPAVSGVVLGMMLDGKKCDENRPVAEEGYTFRGL